MESLSPLKLIKVGFWIGLGFIVPNFIGTLFSSASVFLIPSFWQSQGSEMAERMLSDMEKTNQVRIKDFRESTNGNQVLIIGAIENTGNTPVGSIQIEAELYDGKKQMVFECSEYISKRLKPAEEERFQIKCGCGNQPVPAHESLSVRVVNASSY